MWNKVRFYIIAIVIGGVLGGSAVYAIAKAGHTREFARLSDIVRTGEVLNRTLQADNSALRTANTDAQRSIRELELQLDRDHKQSQAQIERIRATVSDIGSDLAGSGSSIQTIIDGIGSLRKLIEALP